jgi:eukaryotic-like serine/threonine-protein kinase
VTPRDPPPPEEASSRNETRRPAVVHSAASEDQFASGTEIGGYRIVRLRSVGGFASLYRAARLDSGEPVALKVLHPYLVADPLALKRLWREADTLNELHHPHIVRVFECGEAGAGRPFIAMEWLEGRTLQEELGVRGPFSPFETLTVMEQLCGAVAAAHELGIVHCDIKAQNVMAVPRDDWFTVKLVDFGVIKLMDRGRSRPDPSMSSQLLGTPLNMAPEQILGQPVDERTDVYALGLLLYQLLTGTLPFRGANAVETEELQLQAPVPRLNEILPVSPGIDAVLQRSLQKSRLRRYASVHEFLDELGSAVLWRPPAADSGAPHVGIYVRARVPPDADCTEDEMLDDLDRVLAAARGALTSVGLWLAIESADAVLGVAGLPEPAKDATRFRQRLLDMAVSLADRLARRPDPVANVYIAAHVATASTRIHRGRGVLGGDLLCLRDWAGGLVTDRVVATDRMLEGLDGAFAISPAGRTGSKVVRPR